MHSPGRGMEVVSDTGKGGGGVIGHWLHSPDRGVAMVSVEVKLIKVNTSLRVLG